MSWQGTTLGVLLWIPCVVIAGSGYGALLGRVARHHVAFGLRCISGLAAMLAISTVAARAGALPYWLQFAFVGLGLVLCAFATKQSGGEEEPVSWATVLFGATAIAVLLVLSVLDPAPPIADGTNHVLTIKRLWDTGSLGTLHYQGGTQVVAESYFALLGGPSFVSAFEGELCGALLVLLLACTFRPSSDRMSEIVFVVITLAVVLDPGLADDDARWSGALLFVGAFIALRTALQDRRVGWHAVAIALALGSLRHEYLLVAVPFVAAGLVLPRVENMPGRSALVAASIAWAAVLVIFQTSIAVPLVRAVEKAGLLALLIPVTFFLTRRQGLLRWNDAVTVAAFGAVTIVVAVALDAIRPVQHSEAATFAVMFGLATCLVLHATSAQTRDGAGPFTHATAGFTIAAFVVVTLLEPSFKHVRREEIIERFRVAISALRELDGLGLDVDAARDVSFVQTKAPPGAKIGFWGQNPGALDFVRNPVRDVSWMSTSARKRRHFLHPLSSRSLTRLDYVIVEDVPPPAVPDPWELGETPEERLVRRSPIADVEPQLEHVATAGAASLYRVRVAR
jgi:hypothetical protein